MATHLTHTAAACAAALTIATALLCGPVAVRGDMDMPFEHIPVFPSSAGPPPVTLRIRATLAASITLDNDDDLSVQFLTSPYMDSHTSANHVMHPVAAANDGRARFEAQVMATPGTKLQYRFARGWEKWETLAPKDDVEHPGRRVRIVPHAAEAGNDGMVLIDDIIHGFVDANPKDGGWRNVTGRVVDSADNDVPVMFGFVHAGGAAGTISTTGEFFLYGVPTGEQAFVVTPHDGSHRPVELMVNVPAATGDAAPDAEGWSPPVEVQLVAPLSRPVRLAFNVLAPMPPTGTVRVVGDIQELGMHYPWGDMADGLNLHPVADGALTYDGATGEALAEVAARRGTGRVPAAAYDVPAYEGRLTFFTGSIVVPAGTIITYRYTYGSLSMDPDLRDNTGGSALSRAVVVAPEIATEAAASPPAPDADIPAWVLQETVRFWRSEGSITFNLQVSVPHNTRMGPQYAVYVFNGNTLTRMSQDADDPYLWRAAVSVLPYWTFDYLYTMGTYTGFLFEQGRPLWSGNHRVADVSALSDGDVITDTVPGWFGIDAADEDLVDGSGDGTVSIEFVVTVPHFTPDDATLHLAFAPTSSDATYDASRPTVALTKRDEHSWGVGPPDLALPRHTTSDLVVVRGDADGVIDAAAVSTRTLRVTPSFGGERVNDFVTGWADIANPYALASHNDGSDDEAADRGIVGGTMPFDWWDHSFTPFVDPYFRQFAADGGTWTQYALIYNVDHMKPTMFVSSNSAVGTPPQDLAFIVDSAHAAGLRVMLSVGFNTEMTPDGPFMETGGVGYPHLYDEQEWEAVLTHLMDAIVAAAIEAERLGVELIELPQSFLGANDAAEYDARFVATLDRVRDVYHGRVTGRAGSTEVTSPTGVPSEALWSKLDIGGTYLWDDLLVGVEDPTVDQLAEAFGANFDERYEPMLTRHNQSLVLTQVAYGSIAGPAYRRAHLPTSFDYVWPVDEVKVQDPQARLYEGLMRAAAARPYIRSAFSFGTAWFQWDFPEYGIDKNLAEKVVLKWNAMRADADDIGFGAPGELPTADPSAEAVSRGAARLNSFTIPAALLSEARDAVKAVRWSPAAATRHHSGRDASDPAPAGLPEWGAWVEFTPGDKALDLSDALQPLASPDGGGTFVLWIQGRFANGHLTHPSSMLVYVDAAPPRFIVDPLGGRSQDAPLVVNTTRAFERPTWPVERDDADGLSWWDGAWEAAPVSPSQGDVPRPQVQDTTFFTWVVSDDSDTTLEVTAVPLDGGDSADADPVVVVYNFPGKVVAVPVALLRPPGADDDDQQDESSSWRLTVTATDARGNVATHEVDVDVVACETCGVVDDDPAGDDDDTDDGAASFTPAGAMLWGVLAAVAAAVVGWA